MIEYWLRCVSPWAGSLVGRASLLHSEGREFESLPVHSSLLTNVNSYEVASHPLFYDRSSIYAKSVPNIAR